MNKTLKNKKIWTHIAHSFEEAEEFDRWFWKQAGPAARLSAAWSLVSDFFKMRGQSGRQPRLRRTIRNIEHI